MICIWIHLPPQTESQLHVTKQSHFYNPLLLLQTMWNCNCTFVMQVVQIYVQYTALLRQPTSQSAQIIKHTGTCRTHFISVCTLFMWSFTPRSPCSLEAPATFSNPPPWSSAPGQTEAKRFVSILPRDFLKAYNFTNVGFHFSPVGSSLL